MFYVIFYSMVLLLIVVLFVMLARSSNDIDRSRLDDLPKGYVLRINFLVFLCIAGILYGLYFHPFSSLLP